MENNRRLALALALVVIVVLLTQFLFPQRRAPVPVTARTPAGAPAGGPAATTAPTAAAATASPTVAAPAGTTTPSPAGTAEPLPPAETITVSGTSAAYDVSSVGASLTTARMLGYNSLAPARLGGGAPVQLTPTGEPILSYRLVVPGDTLPLSRVPFRVSRPSATAVQLDGTTTTRAGAPVAVSIVYSFVPDSFVAHVRGTVQGVTGPAYLLTDLPSTLRITEPDTLEHFTHLAYAYKPATKDAKSVAFSRIDPGERQIVAGPLTWAVAKSKYFLVGALAPNGAGTRGQFTELDLTGGVRTTKLATRAAATLVQQLDNGGFAFDLYAGPQEWRHLHAMGRDFENANPYGGWTQGIVQPFATLVIRALLWMHDSFKLSYGWVLILFGVTVRLILWPLQQGAMRSQLKMQRVQPELQAVQERYKSDPQKLQQEMMKVYAAHGMSPFSALSGCLPMLIPLPIFFALFFVFQNTIEFRGVPFLWLHDISLKDPYYVLPILVAVTQFLMSWIGMRGAPPNPQAQMLTYAMPAMFLFFFINVASGLNLYYLTQNLIMLPQQWLLARERQKAQGKPVVQGTPVRAGSPMRR
ncbi:Membrane protein oxaA [Gemmatirosa kalamazoonensis]|uniref:Membrane protein insertase YidC n=1 Tax=Gemmatirosa kalamazoonensis TaxID=861299 RepID=W0RBX7_9BACT|nr:membrane protein insertase YidC [Gemmatirosa kalamazoonensis]AHG88604.1 Membrane protein oxaA [Gemmatirosa kalamazoonensis]